MKLWDLLGWLREGREASTLELLLSDAASPLGMVTLPLGSPTYMQKPCVCALVGSPKFA